MTRITATDHVLLLLQDRLEKAQRRGTVRKPEQKSSRERIEAMATVHDLDERNFRKALVRGLLTQALGETLTADPAFDGIINRVLSSLEDSPEGRALLIKADQVLGRV